MRNKNKIAIIDQAEIIRNGLPNMIMCRSNQYEIKALPEPQNIDNYVRNNMPDILIINPAVFSNNQRDKLKLLKQSVDNPDIKLVALVYAYFDNQLLSLFDEVIYINDSSEKVVSKLDALLAKESEEKEVANANNLSLRELDVIRLVALGHSNKEIADKLCISIHTVISHRKNITTKLGVKSTSALTIYAVINKLIDEKDYCKSV